VSSAPLRCRVRRRRALLVSLLLSLLPLPVHAVDPNAQKPVIDAPEVAISATRTERSVLDLAGNVTVIDAEAIERSGARTVPDLLRREAGLMVTSLGSTPEGFTVEARGFNNGGGNGCSTLVLVDGRRINEPETGCPDWSFVTLAHIDRIEIVRGPASVAYGDNAAAGVIHIFTYRPREDGARIVSAAETGSYGGQAGGVRVSAREGGVFATSYFNHTDSNGYRNQSDFDWDAARLGIGFDLAEAGEIRIDGGFDSNLRERPGALLRDELHDDRRQADPGSTGDDDRARSRFLSALLDLRPREDVRIQLVPYVRRRTDDGRLSTEDFEFVTDTETEMFGSDAQVEVAFDAFGQRHTFLAGGELRREDSHVRNFFDAPGPPPFTSDTDVQLRRNTWGLFAQQEVGLRDDLHLLLGVRRDQVEYGGSGLMVTDGVPLPVDVDDRDDEASAWSPRASLTWRVAEPIGLYAGFARGFRSANLQETVSFSGVAPVDPQKTESYEIGGKYRSQRCAFNLALYWMDVDDEILFDPLTFQNTNLERVQHRGVELSGNVRVLEWLEVYASYTLDDVRIREGIADAGHIPIMPKHRGALGATVFLPWGFEVGADALWIGSRWLANDLTNDLPSHNLSSYGVYDARFAWRGGGGPFAIVLEAIARNLTDREYSDFGAVGAAPGYYPSPERNYILGARVEYRL
jgi:iron complex outermembrane recepter protein